MWGKWVFPTSQVPTVENLLKNGCRLFRSEHPLLSILVKRMSCQKNSVKKLLLEKF